MWVSYFPNLGRGQTHPKESAFRKPPSASTFAQVDLPPSSDARSSARAGALRPRVVFHHRGALRAPERPGRLSEWFFAVRERSRQLGGFIWWFLHRSSVSGKVALPIQLLKTHRNGQRTSLRCRKEVQRFALLFVAFGNRPFPTDGLLSRDRTAVMHAA